MSLVKKLSFISLSMFLILFTTLTVKAETTTNNILILCSYTYENSWENSVVNSIKENLPSNYNCEVIFLDLGASNSPNYKDHVIALLNNKYSTLNFDTIVTIDDEALSFVRENIKNESTIFYKKKVIFLGANEYVFLNNYEKDYVTGVLEYRDNTTLINNILETNKNINNIYIVLNNSIYCKNLKRIFLASSSFCNREFNLEFIQSDDFNYITKSISNIDHKTSAIILCGDYSNNDNTISITSKETIETLKSITKAPIYTTIKHYVESGAIGGIVNDGNSLGKLCSLIIERNKEVSKPILPIYNTFSLSYFNFDAIREYSINPLKIPSNSTIINKKPYQVMLPLYYQLLIWGLIIVFLVGLFTIITLLIKEKKSSNTIKNLLNQEEIKNHIKNDFIITISHELRTPLNIILNATKLIELKLKNEDFKNLELTKELTFINKNSNRLQKLINNIIDVNKLETGFMNVSFKMGNIVEVIEDTTQSIVSYAKANNISVTFDTDEEEIITAFDKLKIERIMLNLLSNSIKYNKENGEVYVNLFSHSNNVTIEIRDTGIGMDETLLSNVFNKFKRGTSSSCLESHKEGSGLGLYIVKKLVEMHNGEIVVSSTFNIGSKFTIILPLISVDEISTNEFTTNDELNSMVNLEFSDLD